MENKEVSKSLEFNLEADLTKPSTSSTIGLAISAIRLALILFKLSKIGVASVLELTVL